MRLLIAVKSVNRGTVKQSHANRNPPSTTGVEAATRRSRGLRYLPASSTNKPFCACIRFSAWSKIAEFGVREVA